MKILVTGANGFIGRHLCTALQEAGHAVTSWDLPDQDITDPQLLITGPRELDAVVHLAAIAAPITCDRNPGLAFQINVQGTHNVLKMAVQAGAKRFILASTGHVYGISPKYLPSDERHPLQLQDTYTVTKLAGEQLCQLFWENYGLSYCAIRLFNGYGPGQPLGYFVPDKLAEANTGKIVLRGSQVTKDWVFIDDVVRAYQLAVESPFVGPVNIGTGREHSLETLGRFIAASYDAKLELADQPADRATRMCADRRRAKQVLGWEPQVGLEEGLARTIVGVEA